MKKISLVIGDEDISYIESLANYIRNSDYSSRFNVKLFSQQEHLNQYISSSTNINVLLANNSFLEANENIENNDIESIIKLLEQPNEEESSQTVFKYQPLNNLLSEVIRIYYERHGKVKRRELSEASIKIALFIQHKAELVKQT